MSEKFQHCIDYFADLILCMMSTPTISPLSPAFARFLALPDGRLPVVRFLLESGASPDGVAQETGGCGATPLHR